MLHLYLALVHTINYYFCTRKPISYALQFHTVRTIPPDSLPALLVCLRPLHQQVEVAVEVAERFRGGGKLCFLRLVGLEVFAANSFHLVLFVG